MSLRAGGWLAAVAALSILVGLAWQSWSVPAQAPARPSGARERFSQWQSKVHDQADAYLLYLRRQGVAGVLPPEQLLRLGRRWAVCGGNEFAVPPRSLWPRIVPTLRLLSELRAQGFLEGAQVASAWRPGEYNRCEGGSSASRHLNNSALDLDLPAAAGGRVQELCALWRRTGSGKRWGLGFYSPTQVHLDTEGFRTWGFDYRAGSSLCKAAG